MANKIIISCAITGSIHTPTMSDALPITPDQIATQAIDAAAAGAAVVPPSPPALMPSGLVGESTSAMPVSNDGNVSERGMP